jgi:hypothetical protein
MLAKFLRSHHHYRRICYGRELSFEPRFSISILDTDWSSMRALSTRHKMPSMHEVITAALASFQQDLALFRMCKEFAEKVLRRRLPCDDCCEAVVDALTL